MRVAYLFHGDFTSFTGVHAKIESQILTWRQLGCDVVPVCLLKGEVEPPESWRCSVIRMDEKPGVFGLAFDRAKIAIGLKKTIDEIDPELIYMRAGELSLPCCLAVAGRKLVVEVNTNLVPEVEIELADGLLSKRAAQKKTSRHFRSLKRADGVVGVTQEIAKISAKVTKGLVTYVPNSIRYSEQLRRARHSVQRDVYDKNIPSVFFMGSAGRKWHGLDRLVELAKATAGRLHFVQAGEFVETNLENFESIGYVSGEKLDQVLAQCDVGIASLATFRSEMYQGSTLKVRDYANHGLALVLPHKDSAFLDREIPEWAFDLSNGDGFEEGEIDALVQFSKKWYGNRVEQAETAPYFDSSFVEKKRVSFFKDVVDS